MAAMNTSFTSTKQKVAAERVASYGAEQRRLKAAAAGRRAAAAAGGEKTARDFSARQERPRVGTRRSKYLA